MGPIRRWLVYVLGVLLGGALLAPWVYALARFGAEHWPVLQGLADHPFRRYLNRCLLLLAVAVLWSARRQLNLGPRREWGWSGGEHPGRLVVAGLGLGFGAMTVSAGAGLAGGALTPQTPSGLGEWGHLLLFAGMSAVAVAALEETLFRGILWRSVRRAHRWGPAAWFSSLIYAWAHFLTKVDWPGPVNWSSGLRVLWRSMDGFLTWEALIPGFPTLVLAGLLLALACERTGGLWLPAGLHAGWVLGRKLTDGLTHGGADRNGQWAGWLAFGLLLLTGWILHHRFPGAFPEPVEPLSADEPPREELA